MLHKCGHTVVLPSYVCETWNLNLCQFWKSIPVHLKFFSIKLFQFQQKSKTQETHVILSGQRKKMDISDSLEKRGKNKLEKQKQFYAQL